MVSPPEFKNSGLLATVRFWVVVMVHSLACRFGLFPPETLTVTSLYFMHRGPSSLFPTLEPGQAHSVHSAAIYP